MDDKRTKLVQPAAYYTDLGCKVRVRFSAAINGQPIEHIELSVAPHVELRTVSYDAPDMGRNWFS